MNTTHKSTISAIHPVCPGEEVLLPCFEAGVSAGFPSVATDHMEHPLDLNAHMIRHPAATFFVRVRGDSMQGAGIDDGDLLVVDRSLAAAHKQIVIAVVAGEFLVKRLIRTGEGALLRAENANYKDLPLTPDTDASIWGVVSFVIKKLV